MADEQKQQMIVGEFLFLAKQVSESPAAVLAAPVLLFDESAEKGESAPLAVIVSEAPISTALFEKLPHGTLALRVARYEPPKVVTL